MNKLKFLLTVGQDYDTFIEACACRVWNEIGERVSYEVDELIDRYRISEEDHDEVVDDIHGAL